MDSTYASVIGILISYGLRSLFRRLRKKELGVIGKGSHYCLSLKGNQNKSFDEVRYLFNTTSQKQIVSYEPEITKEHGRIEQYKISLISGRFLSKIIKEKWLGLDDGSIVKVERNSCKRSTNNNTSEERFYITSLPPIDENSKRVN